MSSQSSIIASPSVVVFGGKGMLGSDLTRYLRQKEYNIRALDLPEFDITNPAHLEKAFSGVDIVVNCAAFTDVDGAEDAPEAAMAVNAIAVGEMGRLAVDKGVYIVHISTDFVFDGRSTNPYSETDCPNPLSVYGKSKLQGERMLESTGCFCAIMRVQWSYGEHGTNFIFKILDRAQSGRDLKIVDDQVGSPTWTIEMARAIEYLIQKRSRGVYHFAAEGYASRFEVGYFIASEFGFSNRILPCSSSDFLVKAPRPLNSRFDITRIQSVLNYPIRNWREALSEFIYQTAGGHNKRNLCSN